MNPAAPRDPRVTRVLLLTAAGLFLMNFYVYASGLNAPPDVEPAPRSAATVAHSHCLEFHVPDVVARVDLDNIEVDLSRIRTRLDVLHSDLGTVSATGTLAAPMIIETL